MSTEKTGTVGKEILSLCGKCKLALAHVIVTVDGAGDADKCECKTCGAVHKYKDPDKSKKTRKPCVKTPKKESVPIETLWNEAVSGAKGSSINYAMTSAFDKGDLISHSTFGQGVVQELIGHNKIRVIFNNSEKILIHRNQQV